MNKQQYRIFAIVLFVVFILDMLWAYLDNVWDKQNTPQLYILMCLLLAIPLSLFFYTGKE